MIYNFALTSSWGTRDKLSLKDRGEKSHFFFNLDENPTQHKLLSWPKQTRKLPAKLKCAGKFQSWLLIGSFLPGIPACSAFVPLVMAYGICVSNMAASMGFGTSINFGDKNSNNPDSWQDANTALAELDKGALVKSFNCINFDIGSFVFCWDNLCWCSYIVLILHSPSPRRL